jgi:hypothetical protein
MAHSMDRVHSLSKSQEGGDTNGEVSKGELSAIAGSDMTSKSVPFSCSVNLKPDCTTCAKHTAPHTRSPSTTPQTCTSSTLQAELDAALKRLPYLKAVVNEVIQKHFTSAIGFPQDLPLCASLIDSEHSYIYLASQQVWHYLACC